MADDLDALLDEVESKFCRNVSVISPSPSDIKETKRKTEGKSRTQCSTNQVPRKSFDEDDIDSLLEDILDDGDSLNLDMPKATKNDCKSSLSQPAGRRCCPVFLGGSSVATGVGTSTSQRACSQLRCTSCDFRVMSFDDHEWDSSCDYLFFRNNMPDRQKLQAKLKRKRTSRAYACQCSWRSTLILTDLRDQPELKWVCGKHES
ncbi:protein C8orf37 homolog [Anguilla anguilla]|uniref:protein C8orf37 homolog n=1 Tax=Anguilla anguilla TaxID=7936 RepID=UPI0015AFD521|nr:protein C8orf37 homolog [Anguilla anguilla]